MSWRWLQWLASVLLAMTVVTSAWGQEPTEARMPAPERVFWNKTPIAVSLRVGHERRVSFPGDVRVGMPPALTDSVRTQSVNGTVYWLAHEPFEAARVQLQDLDTGRVYLVDLRADEHGRTAPLEIHLPQQRASTSEGTSEPQSEPGNVGYVTLTRHAAQQMYAPKRLLRNPPGVFRAKLKIREPVPLLRGGAVEATPLASWRGGGLYVTAVKLRNITAQPVVLDPRDLRGRWLTATFQHARLLPHGDEADTTCAYLVSARPFAESL
ncbi:MAG: TIGR03749 family integrating conjugative element protein [Gammaproteobacteria bacterium]|nr:TIGR03749 family integrating conjugative element protein [Gammaproteobacteria bacterium]